ncbi:MAG: addiction module toxin RelE [Bacteroidales bacterium]|nr:addiction module toxin RelE [Bacteroidales bacterium]
MIEVVATDIFAKQAKCLYKKYPSIKNDIEALSDSLSENPLQGIPINDKYRKIRMRITSKGKGKSSGARVITLNLYVESIEDIKKVVLVTIYDKSEKESISENEIDNLLKNSSNEI